MTPKERDKAYLQHLRDCCERIREYASVGREAFLGSTMRQDAVIRNFQVIGEAAKNLSEETRSVAEFPWRDAVNFRNFVVHQYSGVDYGLVWRIIADDLPALEAHVLSLLSDA